MQTQNKVNEWVYLQWRAETIYRVFWKKVTCTDSVYSIQTDGLIESSLSSDLIAKLTFLSNFHPQILFREASTYS